MCDASCLQVKLFLRLLVSEFLLLLDAEFFLLLASEFLLLLAALEPSSPPSAPPPAWNGSIISNSGMYFFTGSSRLMAPVVSACKARRAGNTLLREPILNTESAVTFPPVLESTPQLQSQRISPLYVNTADAASHTDGNGSDSRSENTTEEWAEDEQRREQDDNTRTRSRTSRKDEAHRIWRS